MYDKNLIAVKYSTQAAIINAGRCIIVFKPDEWKTLFLLSNICMPCIGEKAWDQ